MIKADNCDMLIVPVSWIECFNWAFLDWGIVIHMGKAVQWLRVVHPIIYSSFFNCPVCAEASGCVVIWDLVPRSSVLNASKVQGQLNGNVVLWIKWTVVAKINVAEWNKLGEWIYFIKIWKNSPPVSTLLVTLGFNYLLSWFFFNEDSVATLYWTKLEMLSRSIRTCGQRQLTFYLNLYPLVRLGKS